MKASLYILGGFGAAVTFAWATLHYWEKLFESNVSLARRWFVRWSVRGLLLPMAVWTAANLGFFPWFPPLLPEVAIAKRLGGPWMEMLLGNVCLATVVIGSFWSAVTLGWICVLIWDQTTNRRELGFESAVLSAVFVPLAGFILYRGGLVGLGFAGLTWFLPLVHFSLPWVQSKKRLPSYDGAVGRMKFGKYREAEEEVIKQLEKCENDFDGWMMLAGLYANQFHELSEADRTIRELCRDPGMTSLQISIALHRLADWHLKIGGDPASARHSLEEIIRLAPGSHSAHMAQLRIAQLPTSREELQERQKGKKIKLPALRDDFDAPSDDELPEQADGFKAAVLVEQQAERLRRDPNDISARESYATLLAEQLGEVELAIEQVELLLGMPEPSAKKAAEWLATIAAWHLKYRGDAASAKRVLERIVREYPETSQAFAAQRRLSLMETESRFRRAKS